jgi:hypothetical protein
MISFKSLTINQPFSKTEMSQPKSKRKIVSLFDSFVRIHWTRSGDSELEDELMALLVEQAFSLAIWQRWSWTRWPCSRRMRGIARGKIFVCLPSVTHNTLSFGIYRQHDGHALSALMHCPCQRHWFWCRSWSRHFTGAKRLLASHRAAFIPTHLSTSDSFPKLTIFHGKTLQFNVMTL